MSTEEKVPHARKFKELGYRQKLIPQISKSRDCNFIKFD
jgi:hypothetical protein